MKKIKLSIFMLVAAVMLTGCDSSDYKKATALYESENYKDAYAAFTELGDYEDSANMAKVSLLAYAQNLTAQSKYAEAVGAFQELGDMDGIDEILDDIAASLVSQNDYENAKLFLYRHSTDEEMMKEFYYQFLSWQMENCNYSQTATTFDEIKGYKDTLTNEKFFGARLMAMEEVTHNISEISFRRMVGSALTFKLSFSQEQLMFNIYGGNISLYSGAFSDEVDISDEWPYKFDGKEIYVKEDDEYIKCGTIIKFNEGNGEEKESVTLSLDLPGMMTITECDFEIYEA